MEQFATEEQQVEAIKRFWKDHGTAIIVGAVIGLGALWGWRYYSQTQIEAQESASTQYQTAIEAVEQENGLSTIETFIKNNEATGYAHIAGLVAAQQAVENGDLDTAASHLKTIMTSADSHIATIAGLRLARVQLELQQADAALSTLDKLDNDSFAAEINDVKGDIYVSQQKFDDARMAYTSALEKRSNDRLLQMKLDNLSVAAGS
ncbi:tetratricopeptide repeat protein [Alteromonas pelagimontana]|uniref:Ancillary SecYEG translocon subunit n=1 Tax=Alteromonas pelagimontana TaxID=1858656 RepID=A0A6M4MG31_9ALTE|nr:tetratricopeptide repeat protein [Alteromonas pelagimontana]QJR82043.1 tetratricopeptide repeat protein [Alteromonas pelagimontana]